jgi:hypothetical protein
MAGTADATVPVGGIAVSLSSMQGTTLQHIANLQYLYRTCPDDIKASARTWYEDNDRRVVAYGMASPLQLTPNQARAIFALYSQMMGLHENWAYFRMVCDGRDIETIPHIFNRQIAPKVRAVLADPENVAAHLGESLKIPTFYANHAGDHSRVTVDRWAIRALLWGQSVDRIAGDALYLYAQQVYRIVASMVGETPAALQAILWVWVRRVDGYVD